MPKRRIPGNHPRRLGRTARQRQRGLADVIDLNPPPNIGDTIVLAQDYPCSSCPREIAEGDEGTYIDGELNCRECTEEARHG